MATSAPGPTAARSSPSRPRSPPTATRSSMPQSSSPPPASLSSPPAATGGVRASNAGRRAFAKRVRWSTITIHEFGVGHGGSAVPKTGPSIGLARKPEFTWSTAVGLMARENEGVRRFSSAERVALLREAGFTAEVIETFVEEAADVRSSRELYYSVEMKLFRKKRKRSKAAARADRASESEARTKRRTRVDAGEEMKPSAGLRIDPRATPPLEPPPRALSPCCS